MPHSVHTSTLDAAITITTTITTSAAIATTTPFRIKPPALPSPMLVDWSRSQDRSSITIAEILLLKDPPATRWANPFLPFAPDVPTHTYPSRLFSRSAFSGASFGRNHYPFPLDRAKSPAPGSTASPPGPRLVQPSLVLWTGSGFGHTRHPNGSSNPSKSIEPLHVPPQRSTTGG